MVTFSSTDSVHIQEPLQYSELVSVHSLTNPRNKYTTSDGEGSGTMNDKNQILELYPCILQPVR